MDRRRPFVEFKNIRVLPSGYQVTITRGKNEFSRHFAGHGERSYRAAIRFRNRALRELPPKRLNEIPRRVLEANGLSEAVVGVSRNPGRSLYQVNYPDKTRLRSRAFVWGKRSEAAAYAAAVAFRKSVLLRRS